MFLQAIMIEQADVEDDETTCREPVYDKNRGCVCVIVAGYRRVASKKELEASFSFPLFSQYHLDRLRKELMAWIAVYSYLVVSLIVT